MDEKENTGTESSAVTAIKVKVVIDTNKKELDQQFNSIKEHYKDKPVKIAFGVNQNDTIRNINDALDKVVKSGKLKTPKVTLDVKIDQSKVTAQLKKAMQSAAKQTVKVNAGKSSSAKADAAGASEIKQLEKFVEQAKAKTTEWKSSIKGTTEEAHKLSDNLQKILNQINALDKDHNSKGYASGVSGLKAEFSTVKEQVSDYTKEYQKLERQATSTLDNIRKQQTKLKAHGITKFDNQLSGFDNYIGAQDKSLISRLKNLDGIDPQSEKYAKTLNEILVDWEKINAQINEAIRAEGNLSVSATARQKKIKDVADSIQGLRNVAMGSDVAKNKELKKYAFGDTTKNADSGVLHDLDISLDNLKAAQNNPAEFVKQLQLLETELGNVSQKLTEYKKKFQESTSTTNESTNLRNLVTTINKYEETLNNLDKRQDLKKRLYDIRDAAEAQSKPFNVLSNEFAELKIDMESAGIAAETLGQKLSRLFKEHFQTAIAMAGVAMVKQGLREVYNNVLELDTAVTELKKVSSMTGDEMNSYLERTATNARELGASISDLVTSTADWKRLGYSDEDSEELARVAALMANVGDGIDNATTASSYLISTMQGFGLIADDAEHLLDCMNQIANTEPVSMEDLGIIMQKSSAAMSAAGNTYQETLAMASALNGVLQDSESSGTYMKTLSMYLRASKTDAEEAGIATDGMASSVSELRSELKQLAGVDIMKNDNTFKSTYQIMKELSEVWKDLSDTTQANITELISGKRGGQGTSALLNNFSVAEDAMKQALNSSGSAMRENETYMQSLQAKLNQLDSAFQKFSTDLMSSEIPKFFVDLATIFVDGADSAVKFAGALPTLTAAISGVLSVMQMSGKLKNGAGKVNMPSYICCT
nr:MAG TPA: minor tail protein [Bacteriophage sp.]